MKSDIFVDAQEILIRNLDTFFGADIYKIWVWRFLKTEKIKQKWFPAGIDKKQKKGQQIETKLTPLSMEVGGVDFGIVELIPNWRLCQSCQIFLGVHSK